MNTTALISIVFLSALFVSVFYWQVIHVSVLTGIRFRLFARRDELRRLAITGAENHTSFAYQEVESFICKSISVVPAISLASFFWFMLREDAPESDSEKRFREEASDELKRLLYETVQDALRTMMLNSPILFTLGVVASFVLWLLGRFNKTTVYQKAETFVDELPATA